jgi:uncharacterized protein
VTEREENRRQDSAPSRSAVIVFARRPVEGRVKTRLAETIGPQRACELYRCFVVDVVAAARCVGCGIHVFVDPPDSLPFFRKWLGNDLSCHPQVGADLGERMARAFGHIFADTSRAVLIGTDCPDLPGPLIADALHGLLSHDAVIGPALDGGYYLIGFSREAFLKDAFAGIEWGADTVYGATMAILEKSGVKAHVLPQWCDVDDWDSLLSLYERQRDLSSGALATVDYLREQFDW